MPDIKDRDSYSTAFISTDCSNTDLIVYEDDRVNNIPLDNHSNMMSSKY